MKRIARAGYSAERTLLASCLAALAALAVGLVATTPANAQPATSGAEKLRRLDIMLMVTGLRCRTTADNFQSDYAVFTTSQIGYLNAATDELKQDFTKVYGKAGAQRELDRLSTTIANTYGQGHPWLTCRELKVVASSLATVTTRATLEEAADQLLSDYNPALRAQWASRR